MLRKFTSVTKWHGTIVPFVLMRDQRSQMDLFTPARSSASLLLRERRGVEKIKKKITYPEVLRSLVDVL